MNGLVEVVGVEHVISDPGLRAGYETDWTGRFSGECEAVVRPGDTAQVAAVLAWAQANGRAVHVQGGNTGLVGGSVPAAEPRPVVILSTARLVHPKEVVGRSAMVGAGVTLGDVQRLAADHGLVYGVDLAARDSATIGGTVATNAGGIRVCHYGMTRSQVQGIEAVLVDGTVIARMGGLAKDNTGFDLAGLLTGSEGTLAVITAVRVKLHDRAAESVVAVFGVDSLAEALRYAEAQGPVCRPPKWSTGPRGQLPVAPTSGSTRGRCCSSPTWRPLSCPTSRWWPPRARTGRGCGTSGSPRPRSPVRPG